MDGGAGSGWVVSKGGALEVAGGAVFSNTVVKSGGTEVVQSGGTANGVNVAKGGTLELLGSSTVTAETLSAGAILAIGSGYVHNTNVAANINVKVLSSGTVSGVTFSAGDQVQILSGGAVSASTIGGAVSVTVLSGGIEAEFEDPQGECRRRFLRRARHWRSRQQRRRRDCPQGRRHLGHDCIERRHRDRISRWHRSRYFSDRRRQADRGLRRLRYPVLRRHSRLRRRGQRGDGQPRRRFRIRRDRCEPRAGQLPQWRHQ